MSFEYYLKEQIKKHPSMQPADVIKLCYQAAKGAEHLLSDTEGARAYLEREYSEVSPSGVELYEVISDGVCRVNLSAWKREGLSLDGLFKLFCDSASVSENGNKTLEEYLSVAEKTLLSSEVSFTCKEWRTFLDGCKRAGMPAVHHSEQYRKKEKPSYRIVKTDMLKAFLGVS